jgi:hypothetical protein
LKANWGCEDALAPSKSAIKKAEKLIQTLDFAVFQVAPGPNGEIMIDLRENGKSVEILFYPTKSKFVKFPTIGLPTQHKFSDTDLPQILSWLNG